MSNTFCGTKIPYRTALPKSIRARFLKCDRALPNIVPSNSGKVFFVAKSRHRTKALSRQRARSALGANRGGASANFRLSASRQPVAEACEVKIDIAQTQVDHGQPLEIMTHDEIVDHTHGSVHL